MIPARRRRRTQKCVTVPVHTRDRILSNNLYYNYSRVMLDCIITRHSDPPFSQAHHEVVTSQIPSRTLPIALGCYKQASFAGFSLSSAFEDSSRVVVYRVTPQGCFQIIPRGIHFSRGEFTKQACVESANNISLFLLNKSQEGKGIIHYKCLLTLQHNITL